jgi:hypothetical protein
MSDFIESMKRNCKSIDERPYISPGTIQGWLQETLDEVEKLGKDQARIKTLEEALRWAASQQPEAVEIFRRENFVFDNKNGRWEKLAFTLYSMLVEIHSTSEQVLKGDEEGEEIDG